ncbi:MAG: right-handed parallel beta-helix repeat-containing protein [Chloroflexi bacterium]|nr:right-handed parallel beta-helix repeat-containing protein [Chloroflexota bacterium]
MKTARDQRDTARWTIAAGLAISACCALGAHAVTVYVDDTGNNSNSGLTTGAAWKTIQHAVNSVSPGDEIVVLPGLYAGARIESSGTSNAPITLRAAAGADVWITAPGANNRHNSNLELEVWDGDWVVRHWIVEGLKITNAPAWGIDARSTQHITIRSNTVIDSGVTGIFTAFCYDITIEGNISHHNGEHGIYHNNSSDRFVIRGNRCYDNANAGIHMNGDLSNPVPAGAPWTLDGLISHGLIEDNLIYNNGPGGAAINMDGVTYTMVRNNVLVLSYNNSGIALFQQNGAEPSHNNQILHNTIGTRSSGGWAINLTQAGCVSNKVYNNIALTDHSWRGSIMIANPNLVGFESDYNIVMDRFSIDGGGTKITFSQWKALGYDTHSIIATPSQLYLDIWQNFHLLATAPAVDAGTTLTSVCDDVELRYRPLDSNNNGSSLPDIGAYERLHGSADSDGDGILDWVEEYIGINPADHESVFVVSDVVPGPAPNQVILKWPSTSGVLYKVRRSTNVPPSYSTVQNNIPATPPMNCFTTTVVGPIDLFTVIAKTP